MPRPVDEILHEIEAFSPTDGVWLPLDDLLAELWSAGVPAIALTTLFRVFERFPQDDGAGGITIGWICRRRITQSEEAAKAWQPYPALHKKCPLHK